jgi:hypothetical protein
VEVGKGVRDMRRKSPIKAQLVQQKAGNIPPPDPCIKPVYLSIIVTQHLVPHQPSCKWGRGGGV